jgi:uncharacterized protein with HEPN domain
MQRDELIQSWFVRHIQILGEALRAVPEEVRTLAPNVPWRKIIGMRHILVHDYFGIDVDAVWQVVSEEPAPLKSELEALQMVLEGPPNGAP